MTFWEQWGIWNERKSSKKKEENKGIRIERKEEGKKTGENESKKEKMKERNVLE